MPQVGPFGIISRNFMRVPRTQNYDNYTQDAQGLVVAESCLGRKPTWKRADGRNGNMQT